MAVLTFREVDYQNYQIIAAANKRYLPRRIERASIRSAKRRREQENVFCRKGEMMRLATYFESMMERLANAERALSKAFDRENLKPGDQCAVLSH
jgi:hypothetical protein